MVLEKVKKSKAGVCYKLIRFVGSFYALIKQYLFISSHAMRIEIMKSDSRQQYFNITAYECESGINIK